MDIPCPQWPCAKDGTVTLGRKELEAMYLPWAELARKGIRIHSSEYGRFNQTPHAVCLAWFRDVLEILTGYGIGYLRFCDS